MLRIIASLGSGLLLAGCAGATGSSTSPAATTAIPSPSESAPVAAIVGTWTRTISCVDMLAAFEAAGIAQSKAGWIISNWVPDGMEADPSDLCANARPPEDHSHFFTPDGQFGSLDAEGNQVDASTYAIVDEDTLSIGSAGAPSGGVLVDYVVQGDSATFQVTIPDDCAADCLEAYAGALSAFYDGDPWVRTDS